MKLRDKKTGEIFDTRCMMYPDGIGEFFGGFSSLAELNEEWEDYEEPEEFWYINECGDVLKYTYDGGCSCPILEAKEIGNYFKTKEEAEKAVEKLKAWKRLKDKWFRFDRWYSSGDTANTILIYAEFPDAELGPIEGRDPDLLFGGEDE